MKYVKYLSILLISVFVIIQLLPKDYNSENTNSNNEISSVYSMPQDIKQILESACHDCHSNNTNYTLYSRIQPIRWLMDKHITQGKKELNFSDFGNYSKRRQRSKVQAIINQIENDEMPLASYKLLHSEARLTEDEKQSLIAYFKALNN